MRLLRRFRGLLGMDPERDVKAELDFHLEMRVRDLVAGGETPERARELATERLGDYAASRDACIAIGERRRRRLLRLQVLGDAVQDLRLGARMLRRSPGFALTVVVTLALGVGANSAIFGVVRAVLLDPLPYRDGERLYRVREVRADGTAFATLSAPNFASLRAESRVFEQVEAYTTELVTLTGAGAPLQVRGARVTVGTFGVLGVTTAAGRPFRTDENAPGRTSVALLDHGFWSQTFGADPGVVGRTILVAGHPHVVVGVLAPGGRLPPDAPGARLPTDVAVYTPLEFRATFDAKTAAGRFSNFLGVIGLARAGVSPTQVNADLRRISRDLASTYLGDPNDLLFAGIRIREQLTGDVRMPLLVLFGAVGVVLLVACVNIANLVLARASTRQAEIAVRAALGAGRGRLIRQVLTESVILGLAGGAAGLGVAYLGTRILAAAQPADVPRIANLQVDGAVVAFTFALSVLAGVIVGTGAAIEAVAGRGLVAGLREGGRGASVGGHRLRGALVVGELALAVVLLSGAALLGRSLLAATVADRGFRADDAATFGLSLQGGAYDDPERRVQTVEAIESRVGALPGVTAVGTTTVLPLGGISPIQSFAVVGGPPLPSGLDPEIGTASVSPSYFGAAGASIRRGRAFSARDRAGRPLVAIVNEAAARVWFGGDPIGRRIRLGGEREIVGVVGDIAQKSPSIPAAPQLFVPLAQRRAEVVHVVVRSAGETSGLQAAVRHELAAIDPDLPMTDFRPLESLVWSAMSRTRFYTSLFSLFALVALALAVVGTFGVMSFLVAQRTREIGLRIALGASSRDVVSGIVGQAMTWAGLGVAIGLGLAVPLTVLVGARVFGVATFDPIATIAVGIVLAISAAAASVIPARRAARIAPANLLR